MVSINSLTSTSATTLTTGTTTVSSTTREAAVVSDEVDKLRKQNEELWKLLNDDNMELESMAQKIVQQETDLKMLRSQDDRAYSRSVSVPRRGTSVSSLNSFTASSPQPRLAMRWTSEDLKSKGTLRGLRGGEQKSATIVSQSSSSVVQGDSTHVILSQQRDLADQIRRERSIREQENTIREQENAKAAATADSVSRVRQIESLTRHSREAESKKFVTSARQHASARVVETRSDGGGRPSTNQRVAESSELQNQAWDLQKELLGVSMDLLGRGESKDAKGSFFATDF